MQQMRSWPGPNCRLPVPTHQRPRPSQTGKAGSDVVTTHRIPCPVPHIQFAHAYAHLYQAQDLRLVSQAANPLNQPANPPTQPASRPSQPSPHTRSVGLLISLSSHEHCSHGIGLSTPAQRMQTVHRRSCKAEMDQKVDGWVQWWMQKGRRTVCSQALVEEREGKRCPG